MIIPVILSGGSGSRLWPLSRKAYPKQFLPLLGGESLFAQTCDRVSGAMFQPPLIISNEDHRFMVAESLRLSGQSEAQIILEPIGRNTAAACAISALKIAENDDDSLVLVLPSDQVIGDKKAFLAAVDTAKSAAEQGSIVTFGISATAPHTGYGYIEVELSSNASGVMPVKAFHEKPDQTTAEAYLATGRHFWNGGIFMFKAGVLIEAFEKYAPDVLNLCRSALVNSGKDLDFLRLSLEDFSKIEDISIDYAIIEKADNIACVALSAGWDDLGSWTSLCNVMDADESGNSLYGDVLLHESRNSLAYTDDGCVALVGVEDVIVVNTRDATLVTTKDRAQDVKAIVEQLKKAERPEAEFHARVHRPWGWYERLAIGARYQVKCIMVKPGAQLSLQSHMHRAEHWVVVEGTIEVTRGDEKILLGENQSTYIPLGTIHRMTNLGKLPAFLIEVQSGSYLGEDDIIRYEDVYGRAGS